MKGRIVRSLLGIFFVCSLLVLSTTAQDSATMLDRESPLPDGRANPSVQVSSGITSIDGSTVTAVWPSTIVYGDSGFEYELCFDVAIVSSDLEFVDRFDVDLPDYWSVTYVRIVDQSPTSEYYCGPVARTCGVDADNVIYWQIAQDMPSYCGPWGEGTYEFCADIIVPYCDGEPWSLPWNIIGDGIGDPLHQVSGTTAPLGCVPAGLYLDGDNIYDSACHGVPSRYFLTLTNHTGAEGTFSLEYDIITGNGTISGPDQIYLNGGVNQDFEVVVTPRGCLRPGDSVEASIIAEGNTFGDISYIHITIGEDGTCPTCTYLPCVLKDD